jgi:hypothetical protein
MLNLMVLVFAWIALGSIIGLYDVVTKKGKRATVRVLVASSSAFFVLCLLGSYLDVTNPSSPLPNSCEVLSSAPLVGERTRYQFRSLSDEEKRFTRVFKKGNFPPPGYRLVSLGGRDLLIRE